jgi:hypothetical protein
LLFIDLFLVIENSTPIYTPNGFCYRVKTPQKRVLCPTLDRVGTLQTNTNKGGRLPYTEQEVAVMLSKKKKTSHVLHLLLSVITAGFWLIVWILVAISNASENSSIDRKIKKGKKI